MLKKLIFIFSIFCCLTPAHGLMLKVTRPGDSTPLSIELHATKRTEHALAVKMADGSIYYADMMPVENSFSGGMFARIDGQIYQIGPAPKFFVTTTTDTNNFSFTMSAAGNFLVDWGDEELQQIVRTDTNEATYSHTYATAGAYTIGIGGHATEYSTGDNIFNGIYDVPSAISFDGLSQIAAVSGSLGAIFSTIGDGVIDGQQPRFARTFKGCSNIVSLPQDLFSGVNGLAASYMFQQAFEDCAKLSDIPEKLFASITKPAPYLFRNAFARCASLTSIPPKLLANLSGAPENSMFNSMFGGAGISHIPEKLFDGVSGRPANRMFAGTFQDCSNLVSIPENLFINFTGPVSSGMFDNTFSSCNSLTEIPENLFGDLYGPAQSLMFNGTFYDCNKLSGKSARINGQYLYDIWPDATAGQVGDCYEGATGLSDYANIPAAWK